MWLWIIAGLVALFVVLLFLLLYIPLEMAVIFDSASSPKLQLRLSWLSGYISLEGLKYLEIIRRRRFSGPLSIEQLISICRIRGLVQRIWQLVRDILNRIRIKKFTLKLNVGFAEPALMGVIFGLSSAVRPLLQLPAQSQLEIRPSFASHYFLEGYVNCTFRVQPVKLVRPVLRFISSPQGRRATRMILFKKK